MTINADVAWSTPANEVVKHPIGLVGASPHVRDESPQFRLGTIANGNAGTMWVYVGPAAADHAAGAIDVNTATFAPAAGVGYALSAPLKTGQYGWASYVALA